MQEAQIIQGAIDTLTGKMLYEFTLSVKHPELPVPVKRGFKDWLLRKPIQFSKPETERKFQIWPCVVINQYRIAAKALSLPEELFDDLTKMLALVPEHLPTLVYIIAAAIQNNHLEPEPELITFLERNLDNSFIVEILSATLQAANMQSFLTSIVLMSGTATIVKPKTSPVDGSE